MAKFKLQSGKRYGADLKLSSTQALFASKALIQSKFTSAGFKDVSVSGSGQNWNATGLWGGLSMEVDLPEEVKKVKTL